MQRWKTFISSADSNPTAPDFGWLIDACIKEGNSEKALLWDRVKKKMHHGKEEAALSSGGSLFGFFTLAAAIPSQASLPIWQMLWIA